MRMTHGQIVYPETRTTRSLRKKVETKYGFAHVRDGEEEVYFSTWIDMEMLELLACKAAGNKSQTAQDGALKVQVISRQRISGGEK